MGGPIGSMRGRRPDDHGFQSLTGRAHAFNSRYQRAFLTRSSTAVVIILAYEHFD